MSPLLPDPKLKIHTLKYEGFITRIPHNKFIELDLWLTQGQCHGTTDRYPLSFDSMRAILTNYMGQNDMEEDAMCFVYDGDYKLVPNCRARLEVWHYGDTIEFVFKPTDPADYEYRDEYIKKAIFKGEELASLIKAVGRRASLIELEPTVREQTDKHEAGNVADWE